MTAVPPRLPSSLLDFFSVFTKVLTSFNLLLSTPIYLSIIFFLYRQRHKKPFDSSFYTLFIALGIVDLSKYWLYVLKKCSYWQWVLPVFEPLNQPNVAANLLYYSFWLLTLCQLQLNLLLSLNRFVSILLPNLFRLYWTRTLTICSLLAISLISVGLATPMLWMPICFQSTMMLIDDNATMTKLTGPVFMNKADQGTYYTYTKSFVYVILFVCLVGYPMMCVRVRKMNMKDKAQAVEARMFYALILLLIANLLYASYILIWEILSKTRPDFAHYAEWL